MELSTYLSEKEAKYIEKLQAEKELAIKHVLSFAEKPYFRPEDIFD